MSDEQEVFDVFKYGFLLYEVDEETGAKTYRKSFEKYPYENEILELFVYKNVFSLDNLVFFNGTNHKRFVIARKYKIKSQSELDFLILNSSVGSQFS